MDKARECWEEATKGPQEPAAAMYYNDAKPDKIFFQGMALLKLGRKDEANGRFYKLINYGKQHIFEHQTMDYFAVSLPDLLIWDDSLERKNLIHCKYMLALGYMGLGETNKGFSVLLLFLLKNDSVCVDIGERIYANKRSAVFIRVDNRKCIFESSKSISSGSSDKLSGNFICNVFEECVDTVRES